MKKQRRRKQPQRKNAQLLDGAKKYLIAENLDPSYAFYMRDKIKKEEKEK